MTPPFFIRSPFDFHDPVVYHCFTSPHRRAVMHKEERRAHPRFTISQAIEVQFPKETIFDAVGIDLSEAGIKLETERDLDATSKIFILVQTGDGEYDKFYFDGIVAWKKSSGKKHTYGIQITDIDRGSLMIMKTFIKHRK